jgi:hemerythrin-like domain-containing protein
MLAGGENAVIAIDNLRHLHDRLRAGLAVVAELEADLLEHETAEVKLEGFDRVVEYLNAVVLPHLRGELAVLYPESRLLGDIEQTTVRKLVENCEEMECDVQRILRDRERLRHGACDSVGFRRHITNLTRRLRRHLEAVETQLLPELQRSLSEEAVYTIYHGIEVAQLDAILELAGSPAATVA